MSVTIEQVECACSGCACVVGVEKGEKRDRRIHCGAACAERHKDGAGD